MKVTDSLHYGEVSKSRIGLVLLYLLCTGLHFFALRTESEFPLLATDEVQYVSVGENLRLGHGFTARGEFHAGLPPLYPMFVAFAHSLGSDTRTWALLLNCLAICLALFPAYGIARLIGLDEIASGLLGAAAAMLPHTVWAGLYMPETLNYPLFLAAFWMFARWVEADPRSEAWLAFGAGVLLSALLLNKVASWSFAAAVFVTVLVLWRRKIRSAIWVFLPVVVTQLAWQAFKSTHHSAGLGMYGHALGDSGLPNLSASLLVAYFADFLLAPGLVLAVPLFLWFHENGRKRFPLAVLLASTLFFQITIHGVLEAGIVGVVKERLFLYSLVLMMIFGVAGLTRVAEAGRQVRLLFVALPLALLGLVMIFGFPYNPVLDVPWASGLGSFAWITVDSFTRRHLIGVTVVLIVAAGIVLARIPVKRVQISAAALLLAFNAGLFASSAKEMTQLSLRGRTQVDVLSAWLSAHVKPGERLVVGGDMAYYQERHLDTPIELFFVNWHNSFGLLDTYVFQIEVLGRYDVRIARNPDQIRELLRPGDHLLVATRMTDLELESYRYPTYLYTRKDAAAVNPRPVYAFDITSELEYGVPLGAPVKQQTYKMLAQPIHLPSGKYRATLYAQAKGDMAVEVVKGENSAVIAERPVNSDATAFEFSTDGTVPVRFRLGGPGIHDEVFQEVRVEYLGPFGEEAKLGPDTGRILPEPVQWRSGSDAELPFSCDIVSFNGAGPRAVYSMKRGQRAEFLWWMNKVKQVPGVPWIELAAENGGAYYIESEKSAPSDAGIQFVRAATNLGAVPAGVYRMRVIRVDGERRIGCMSYHAVTVTE